MDSDERPPYDDERVPGAASDAPPGPSSAHDGTENDYAHDHSRHPHGEGDDADPGMDAVGEFAEELKLLAEAVLERVEPVLRRAAADGGPEWSSCRWCPVCAAAALIRGEQHDLLAAFADHGTAIVTVLREALAGVPVAPVRDEHAEGPTGRRKSAAQEKNAPGEGSGTGYADIPVTIKP
ncbi:hypothetical protein [Nocardia callitridis]|uniref:DUF222 domain-containing protein n=1 Tax=Nocardia callitridis TaxID=648753 RepID=A0ABP9KJK0_9NOCA